MDQTTVCYQRKQTTGNLFLASYIFFVPFRWCIYFYRNLIFGICSANSGQVCSNLTKEFSHDLPKKQKSTEIISVSFSHLELWFLFHLSLNPGSSLILEKTSGPLSSKIFNLEEKCCWNCKSSLSFPADKNLIGSSVCVWTVGSDCWREKSLVGLRIHLAAYAVVMYTL